MRLKTLGARLVAMAAVLGLGTIAALGGAYGVIQYGGNFHAVVPQEVFRSAQLDGDDLTQRIRENGIRSVLNLRGARPGVAWYEEEVRVARALGVAHMDYRLSALRPLTLAQMSEILRWIDTAPKPLLIHCQAGADRTGLVSALYLAARGTSEQEVRQALSIRYGHFPLAYWADTRAMDRSLDLFLSGRRLRP